MTSAAVLSHQSDEWSTPQHLFDMLDREFHFTTDGAATVCNTKCGRFYTDALTHRWTGIIWLNPPYSQNAAFIRKAYVEAGQGATVVCLIPSRTDTAYWHDYCMNAAEIRFIRGRLKFGDGKSPAPFPSAIVIFRPGNVRSLRVTSSGRGEQ